MKRAFDVVLSLLGLVVTLPLMLAIATAVAASMGRPVLFHQTRVGLRNKEFRLSKFRSMHEAFGPDGSLLPDAQRVTAVGRFLRRSRLDELPELWMVLRGDMSFVGPRPLPRHSLEAAEVLDLRTAERPGLTGLAQVSGNTRLSNSEKFAIDILYNENRTFLLDLWILAKTIVTVLTGEKRDEATIKRALDHANNPDRRR